MLLDAWTSQGDYRDLALAVRLGDALVEHAVVEGDRAYWRSVEHRNDDPLLPPAVGWMQGATGIVTYLYRLGRVLDSVTDGGIGGVVDRPVAIGRMDNWWALTPRG